MELKKIIKKLTKSSKLICRIALCGGLLGAAYFFMPQHYKAQGSFYISKAPQVSQDGSFSYEGYYSQQVAISLTKTLTALIESPDVGAAVLQATNTAVSEKSLREYRKKIRVVKTGPQLTTLVAKDPSPETAQHLWMTTATTVENTLSTSDLTIHRVAKNPVITESYKNLPIFVTLGVLSGTVFGIMLISAKEYFS